MFKHMSVFLLDINRASSQTRAATMIPLTTLDFSLRMALHSWFFKNIVLFTWPEQLIDLQKYDPDMQEIDV